MIKTKFGSIVSHKFNNQYICYSSSIQPILKERILSANDSDEFRLSNNSNFLDLNNGFIKKHFWRKGAMSFLNDNYFFYGLKKTRPVRELINYIDYSYIINSSKSDTVNRIEACSPIFSFIKKANVFYSGDIVLSKIKGDTIDKVLNEGYCDEEFVNSLALCFKFLFKNGIYNSDMNLKNILFNKTTGKFSFIDFDKLKINLNKKNNKSLTLEVVSKFEKSMQKHNLLNRFDIKKFKKKLMI